MPLTSTRPELAGSFGMAASTHWLASQTAMSVLERGGNAFDAAAAAGFVLQVVEPHLNGPGGDLPVVLWSERDQQVHVVCGQGVAPAAATVEAFTDLGLDAVPGTGPLAAVVPGAFGGWLELLRRWGTWSLRDVLEPAIGYALDGAPVLPRVSATIAAMAPTFEQEWEPSAQTYLDGGAAPAPWSRLRLTGARRDLPAGARRGRGGRVGPRGAARGGQAGLVRGVRRGGGRRVRPRPRLAGHLRRAAPRPAHRRRPRRVAGHRGGAADRHLPRRAGRQDRAVGPGAEPAAGARPARPRRPAGRARRRRPVVGARGGRVAQAGDGRPGGLVRGAGRRAASRAPSCSRRPTPASARRCSTRAPPRSTCVPAAPAVAPPCSRARCASLLDATGGGGATPSPGVGEPTVKRVEGDGAARGDTCHVDVVDRWGNQVSATPSGAWLQSSPVVPGLGFPLGTRGQMFWLEQGLPASLRPGRASAHHPVARAGAARRPPVDGVRHPRRRPAGPVAADLPAAGGARSRGVDQALQAAIDAPMVHTDHVPSSFYPRQARPGVLVAEDRWPASTLDALRASRPRGGGGRRLVARSPLGGGERGRLAARGRQPARRAGVRGRALSEPAGTGRTADAGTVSRNEKVTFRSIPGRKNGATARITGSPVPP